MTLFLFAQICNNEIIHLEGDLELVWRFGTFVNDTFLLVTNSPGVTL